MRIRIKETAMVFLFIPVILFLFSWFNILVSTVSLLLLGVSLFLYFKEEISDGNSLIIEVKSKKNYIYLILGFFLIVVLALYSGFGGLIKTTDDWRKHHFIIEQLINNSWPVKIESEGETGILSYYLGSYIIPAIVGKIFKTTVSYDVALAVWGVIGLAIAVLLTCEFSGAKKAKDIFVVVIIFCIFTSFIVPAKLALATLAPDDLMSGFLWFNEYGHVVFSSNFTQLRWAFAQAIPGWILTGLLLCYRQKRKHWALILLASMFYSTFVFIGLFFIMFSLFVYDTAKGKIKEFFCLENIFVIIPALVFGLYYFALVTQPQKSYSGMNFQFLTWKGHIVSFLLLQMLWVPYLIILRKSKNREIAVIAGLFLFGISFCSMGMFNDLALRSTIPSMFIFFALICQYLLGGEISKLKKLIIVLVMVACFLPDAGISYFDLTREGITRNNRNPAFSDMTSFEEEVGGEFVRYQYFNWNPDGIIRFIIKK